MPTKEKTEPQQGAANSPYRQAAENAGLKARGGFPQFLEWRLDGFWAVLEATEKRSIPAHTATINGKKKKIPEATVLAVEVSDCVDKTKIGGSFTLGLSGLLAYQLFDDPSAPKKFPYTFGLVYKGKDSEGRHQSTVEFQDSKA